MFDIKPSGEARSMQELLPWSHFVSNEVVLCKDGGLLAAFELKGVDVEAISGAEGDQIAMRLQESFGSFDGRMSAWFMTKKRIARVYPTKGEIAHPVAQWVQDQHAKPFEQGNYFEYTFLLFLHVSPRGGMDGFFERKEYYEGMQGLNPVKSAWLAVKDMQDPMRMLEVEQGKLTRHLEDFEQALQAYSGKARDAGLKRLGFARICLELNEMANLGSKPQSIPPHDALLDQWLPEVNLVPGNGILKFEGALQPTYAGVIGVKEWPRQTTPGLFQALGSVPVELTLVHTVKFLDDGGAKVINAALRNLKITQVGIAKAFLAKATGSEAEGQAGQVDLMMETQQAEAARHTRGLKFALHQVVIIPFSSEKETLHKRMVELKQALDYKGFKAIVERRAMFSSWGSTLPGAWIFVKRAVPNSIENVADSTIPFNVPRGNEGAEALAKAMNRPTLPALCAFPSRMASATVFPGFYGQNGHMIFVAPTRAGKSVTAGFLLVNTRKYGSNVVILDSDRSQRVVTYMMDGQYSDPTAEGVSFRSNPFIALQDGRAGKQWLREWLIGCAQANDKALTSLERSEIDEVLGLLEQRMVTQGVPSFSIFCSLLNGAEIKQRFADFVDGGAYGNIFDHIEDDYSKANSPWVCFEAKKFLENPTLAPRWVDYLLYCTYRKLDGTPTFIYLEEAWRLFGSEWFLPVLTNWVKTLLKKNGFLWAATQSVNDLQSSVMLRGLMESFGNKVFFANPDLAGSTSLQERYQDIFALTDAEIGTVASVVPKMECYLKNPEISRVYRTHFQPELLAVFRSEQHIQAMLDRHLASGSSEWKANFISDVVSQG